MSEKIIYALGFFDGVHLGHQALLETCRELADSQGCQAGAVTFTSHPDGLVRGEAAALLNTKEDRKNLLRAYGMDTVLELPFDKKLMTTHWSSFLRQLIRRGAAGFVCGADFRFGAEAGGTAEKLAAFCRNRGLPYAVVPEQVLDGERISSTGIRSLLEQGDVEQANRFLGHPYILTGKVVSGKQLGRTIQFPTANLQLPVALLKPKFGVYACKAFVDGACYTAVTNIGTRPTVSGEGVTAEAHLLDFEGNLYGKTLRLAFYKFLRPEQKFADLDALKAQIAADITEVQKPSPGGKVARRSRDG